MQEEVEKLVSIYISFDLWLTTITSDMTFDHMGSSQIQLVMPPTKSIQACLNQVFF